MLILFSFWKIELSNTIALLTLKKWPPREDTYRSEDTREAS